LLRLIHNEDTNNIFLGPSANELRLEKHVYSIQNSNMVLESIQKSTGKQLSGHRYRTTRVMLQMSSCRREECVLIISHCIR